MILKDFQFFFRVVWLPDGLRSFFRLGWFGRQKTTVSAPFVLVGMTLLFEASGLSRPILSAQTSALTTVQTVVAQATSQVVAYEGSPLYQEAVLKFRGPSRVYLADSDRRSLDNWPNPSTIVEESVVLDWTDRDLLVVRKDGHDKTTIASARVLRIEPCWQHESAAEFFSDYRAGRFRDAIVKGAKVLGGSSETASTPRWQQRVLIAALIECSLAEGNWERASLLYLSLARSQSPPLLLSTIPIPWSGSSVEIRDRLRLQELAKEWSDDPNEPVQLLAAAWLLDSDRRSNAQRTLTRLSTGADATWVKQYASAQLWRTVPPSDVHAEKLTEWTSLRDAMLLPMQAGPTSLLGDKLQGGIYDDRSMEERLRVLMLHRDRYYLWSRAKRMLKDQLDRSGRSELSQSIPPLNSP